MQKAARKQMIRDAEDQQRLVAEREHYADARIGEPCPRCADIAKHPDPPGVCGAYAYETCWLCLDTGTVATS